MQSENRLIYTPRNEINGARCAKPSCLLQIARHGERAPATTYPNDPYIDNPMEPYGWGQLTNVNFASFSSTKFTRWNKFNRRSLRQAGRINQYNQGLFLRERYNDFLGTSYSPAVFHLQSTYVDRAKMSAQLEAAALWKPNKEQSFKPDLSWQPVVLFYQTRSEDTVKYFCKHLSRRSNIVKA